MIRLMRRRTFLLLLALLAAGMVLGHQLFERWFAESLRDEHVLALNERVSGLHFRLESRLANNLALVNSLAAFISAYPDFTPEQYEQYAAHVLAREPSLVNLAAAPDMVVRYIYPESGNEAVLGLDYMQQPDQREAIERVVATETMVVAGPVELVQGGKAVIGRAPVFVDDGAGRRVLWGIVSAPMLLDEIHGPIERLEAATDIRISIRGLDGLGPAGQVFYGEPALFEQSLRVVMPINVGGGAWQLVAATATDPVTAHWGVWLGRAGTPVFGCILLLALWRRRLNQEARYLLEHRVLQNERFLRAVEGVSGVGGWRLNHAGCLTDLSEQARELFGLQQQQGPVPLSELQRTFAPASVALIQDQLLVALRQQNGFSVELPLQRQQGGPVWLLLKAEPEASAGGDPELIGAVQDVTRAKEKDSLIQYQANYDALTDLPNRTLFMERLNNALWHARRSDMPVAVIFLDLDNFKSVNDNLGHDVGDDLLVEVARRIRSSVRREDTVARYSGDEFVAILPELPSISVVMRIAAEMVACMSEPFLLGDTRTYCSASIGVALFPDDAGDADTLLIKADQAMYEAKRRGRNGWQFYTAEMQLESERKHRLYNELLQALEQNALTVHYQPIFEASSLKLLGCEALIRWRHGDIWVSPEDFVTVAEERGIINRLDCLVLTRALADMAELRRQHGIGLDLAVNVSPRLLQMRDRYSRDWLQQVRAERETRITVEITERMLVENAASAGQMLAELAACGVRVSIDDFGTGYSSLGYLSRFSVQAIKIDRSFVSRIGNSGTEESLIESMVHMASKLGIESIAEGVETEAQIAFLRDLDCTALQGFGLARPMPLDALVAFLAPRQH